MGPPILYIWCIWHIIGHTAQYRLYRYIDAILRHRVSIDHVSIMVNNGITMVIQFIIWHITYIMGAHIISYRAMSPRENNGAI
jgi:hypothetical protein